MVISEKILKLADEAEQSLSERFADIDRIARIRTEKVMEAFQAERVSDAMFAPSTGYGI